MHVGHIILCGRDFATTSMLKDMNSLRYTSVIGVFAIIFSVLAVSARSIGYVNAGRPDVPAIPGEDLVTSGRFWISLLSSSDFISSMELWNAPIMYSDIEAGRSLPRMENCGVECHVILPRLCSLLDSVLLGVWGTH